VSPRPVGTLAAWTVTLVADAVVVVAAAALWAWDDRCTPGVWFCPSAANALHRRAQLLAVLALLLVVVGLLALWRRHLLLALAQVALLAGLVYAAHRWQPAAYDELRHGLGLAGLAGPVTGRAAGARMHPDSPREASR
jgi:hypothetical protein